MIKSKIDTPPAIPDIKALAAEFVAPPYNNIEKSAAALRAAVPSGEEIIASENDHSSESSEQRFMQRLRLLNDIGQALSAERNIDRLLDLILDKGRELTGADAGSLFLVRDLSGPGQTESEAPNDHSLYFRKAQNDSVAVTTDRTFAVSPSSLAGYVALTGQPLCFEDVYHLPSEAPYKFNPSFDRDNGYRTRSILVMPMKNHAGAIIGVLQLINRKRNPEALLNSDAAVAREVIPFDAESVDLAASLASQASVALLNNQLLKNIEELFESFVTASSSAIEDRDPSTAGHSQRVTKLTLAMAEAASAASEGPFAEVSFTPQQLRELRYAGVLHDFGKIGVRENVLTKSHKLEPAHFEVVKYRLRLARQSLLTENWRRKAEVLQQYPGAGAAAMASQLDASLDAQMKELDELLVMLTRANDPAITFLPDDDYARQQEVLGRLSQMTFEDVDGDHRPLLTPEEIEALSVRKGSLTLDEYRQIQMHAALSYDFLKQISWTPELQGIPNIAHCHHEKLNGKGYPRGVLGAEIPLQARMMTVADIYDALTAADRPYKKSLSVDLALQILKHEAVEGFLDVDVVELFVSREIYKLTQVTV